MNKLLKEILTSIFDDLLFEVKNVKREVNEKIDELESEILASKNKLALAIEDIVREKNEELIELLKKSGINSKQKAINLLEGEVK